MHKSLKDCSKRTLVVRVYHTLMTVQLWKSPNEQTRRPEEYHTGQENQTQTVVPTQVDQISLSTFRRCDCYVHNTYITGAFLRGTLSASIRSTSTYGSTSSSFKIAARPLPHAEIMANCLMDGVDETSDLVETRITLEKVAVSVGILSPSSI